MDFRVACIDVAATARQLANSLQNCGSYDHRTALALGSYDG